MREKNYIIGIDHGNGYMKTSNYVFKSGVDTYKVEPPMKEGVLKYEDEYHVIGENRKSYDPDKTKTQDFYYLTLAAIAMEIEKHKYPKKDGSFILACGLPIEYFGNQKESFKAYLERKKEVFFTYSGVNYKIRIKKVIIYPQGYAVIANDIASYTGLTNVIDVGSGTIDILQIIDKKPILTKCISLPMGILTCIESIQKYIRMQYNMELDDYSIQEILQMRSGNLPKEFVQPIQDLIRDYTKKVLAALEQKGINLKFQKCYFCCGGSSVFENYGNLAGENITFNTDIHANAKGFEWLCKGMEK